MGKWKPWQYVFLAYLLLLNFVVFCVLSYYLVFYYRPASTDPLSQPVANISSNTPAAPDSITGENDQSEPPAPDIADAQSTDVPMIIPPVHIAPVLPPDQSQVVAENNQQPNQPAESQQSDSSQQQPVDNQAVAASPNEAPTDTNTQSQSAPEKAPQVDETTQEKAPTATEEAIALAQVPTVVVDTPTPVPTATNTPTPTATPTPSPSPTNTATNTPSPTATATHTPSPTATPTNTATHTPSPTATQTATNTPKPTSTPSPTNTATHTPTSTATATNTPKPTATDTATPKPTVTSTRTPLPTATASSTVTRTPKPSSTFTRTPTRTSTPKPTQTRTPKPSVTKTSTAIPTGTKTSTPRPTVTPKPTRTPKSTATLTRTATPKATPTGTATQTPTKTSTPVPGPTNTSIPTPVPTSTNSPTPVAIVDAGTESSTAAAAIADVEEINASFARLAQPSYSAAGLVDATPLTNGSVALSWEALDDVRLYNIYSDMGSGYGVYIHKARTSEPAFIDKMLHAGTSYTYRLTHVEKSQEIMLAQANASTFVGKEIVDSASPSQLNVSTAASVVAAPTALPPDAVLLGLVSDNNFTDEFNTLTIVGEVRNDSNLDVGQTDIAVTFYNDGGSVIGTASGETLLDVIAPGEKSPFIITLTRPPGLALHSLRAIGRPVPPKKTAQLAVVDVKRFEDDAGFFHVKGVIENIGSSTAKRVKVTAPIYNRDNRVINVGFTYVDPPNLQPGQQATYDITFAYYPRYFSQQVIPFEE